MTFKSCKLFNISYGTWQFIPHLRCSCLVHIVMKTNEKLMDIVKKTASDIANGSDAPIEIQNICKFLKDESILTDKEKLKCCSLCRK